MAIGDNNRKSDTIEKHRAEHSISIRLLNAYRKIQSINIRAAFDNILGADHRSKGVLREGSCSRFDRRAVSANLMVAGLLSPISDTVTIPGNDLGHSIQISLDNLPSRDHPNLDSINLDLVKQPRVRIVLRGFFENRPHSDSATSELLLSLHSKGDRIAVL